MTEAEELTEAGCGEPTEEGLGDPREEFRGECFFSESGEANDFFIVCVGMIFLNCLIRNCF